MSIEEMGLVLSVIKVSYMLRRENTLQDFVSMIFKVVKLNWAEYVVKNPALLRPTEIMVGWGTRLNLTGDLVGLLNVKCLM